ncbi:hypothetical protein V8J82_12280 [Gymnodinialimonas sp. 2305UL16-5]|uniref:hypothetical protein n=1 Tax=Gymnodinialimonas mytili TaxID=3126503 RepID=UPI0030B61A7B
MRRKFTIITLFAAALAVSGCVASDLERAGIGAAAGGVGAAALGGSVGTGVLIGGAAGALCDDVNLC